MHGMNENIKAGAEIHEGGGYSEGTQEAYEAFVKVRNQSLAKARIQQLAEQATDVVEVVNPDAGITQHREVFDQEKFGDMNVWECCLQVADVRIENDFEQVGDAVLVQALAGIRQYFGVEE